VTYREECIGGQRLILGDCLEVLPTLEAGSVDAVVTDPPYGIGDAPCNTPNRRGKRIGSVNDWHPPSDWDKFINPMWCSTCCEAAPVVAWFGHWSKRPEVEAAMSYPIRAEIVWAKNCHTGAPCPLAMRDERIWLFSACGIIGTRFETSVWDEPIIPTWAHREHRNEKPLRLMSRLVSWLTAGTIIDPFLGSGTTLVAAELLGRRGIGIEIDPGYFDIACRRVEQAAAQPRLFQPDAQGAPEQYTLEAHQ